jgi:hypothetical protein
VTIFSQPIADQYKQALFILGKVDDPSIRIKGGRVFRDGAQLSKEEAIKLAAIKLQDHIRIDQTTLGVSRFRSTHGKSGKRKDPPIKLKDVTEYMAEIDNEKVIVNKTNYQNALSYLKKSEDSRIVIKDDGVYFRDKKLSDKDVIKLALASFSRTMDAGTKLSDNFYDKLMACIKNISKTSKAVSLKQANDKELDTIDRFKKILQTISREPEQTYFVYDSNGVQYGDGLIAFEYNGDILIGTLKVNSDSPLSALKKNADQAKAYIVFSVPNHFAATEITTHTAVSRDSDQDVRLFYYNAGFTISVDMLYKLADDMEFGIKMKEILVDRINDAAMIAPNRANVKPAKRGVGYRTAFVNGKVVVRQNNRSPREVQRTLQGSSKTGYAIRSLRRFKRNDIVFTKPLSFVLDGVPTQLPKRGKPVPLRATVYTPFRSRRQNARKDRRKREKDFMTGGNSRHNKVVRDATRMIVRLLKQKGIKVNKKEVQRMVHNELAIYKSKDYGQKGNVSSPLVWDIARECMSDIEYNYAIKAQ